MCTANGTETHVSSPHIAVAALGGTIAMTSETGTRVTPSLQADDLVAAVPQLRDIAHVTATTLATKPSASLTTIDLRSVLDWARAEVAGGAAGVVITQGTDTIDETAYWLDLHWDRTEPLIVTGAMRSPTTPGADGPANLLAAVATAASPSSRRRGVLVVLNDTVHAAAHVVKGRSSGPDAFVSHPFGPTGFVEEGRLHFRSSAQRWAPLPHPTRAKGDAAPPSVALLETHLDDAGDVLDLVVKAGYGGVVIGGFGVGHVCEQMTTAVDRALEAGTVVVLGTRTGNGTTHTHTYGFTGSESDLLARGVIGAGWLHARKARILLTELLARDVSSREIEAEFTLRGAARPTRGP